MSWIVFSEEKEIMQEEVLTVSTFEVSNKFNDALNRHDVQAVMAMMTEDCVFDNTYPPPDGERFEGQEAVRHFWEEFFRSSPGAVFQSEEMFTHGDRCVSRWRYNWTNTDGSRGHVRGVDVLRVRDGKVAEKFAYVKG
jgi:ketosteroid isomerase-like protein